MQEYVKKKPDFISVAYYSERSFQDELSSIGKHENGTITVALAIGVMLVYVSVALGKIRSWPTILVSLLPSAFSNQFDLASLEFGFLLFVPNVYRWTVN